MPPSCNDQIQCGQYSYYCEWTFLNGEWQNANANVPYNYYCAEPPGLGPTGSGSGSYSNMCLWPCAQSSSASASKQLYSIAAYKYRNGTFYLVLSRSYNGGACPGNLSKYSKKNPDLSFLVSFEFSRKPYIRGTYKFQNGEFMAIEGSSETGSWPIDLAAYSKANKDFSFLVTLEFVGRRKKPRRAKRLAAKR